MGHTEFVVSPIDKKRNGTGHPKCLVCVLAEVPAGAPLLKVYAYGPFGARFFCPPPLAETQRPSQPSPQDAIERRHRELLTLLIQPALCASIKNCL